MSPIERKRREEGEEGRGKELLGAALGRVPRKDRLSARCRRGQGFVPWKERAESVEREVEGGRVPLLVESRGKVDC